MIFLDTNVVIDLLDRKRECHNQALMLLSAAQKGALKLATSTQSIVDAAYVVTQVNKVSVDTFRRAMALLTDIIDICPVNSLDIAAANDSTVPDYEDSVQLSCALSEDCEAIVTRDKKFKGYTAVSTYTVEEFYRAVFGDSTI